MPGVRTQTEFGAPLRSCLCSSTDDGPGCLLTPSHPSSSSAGPRSGTLERTSSSNHRLTPLLRDSDRRGKVGRRGSVHSRSQSDVLAHLCSAYLLTPTYPSPEPTPTTPSHRSTGSLESERLARSSSSPQLLRYRARSDSASSSASLTATEDNVHSYARGSASTANFPLVYPPAWSFTPISNPAPHSVGTSSPSEDEGVDGLTFASQASSPTNASLGLGLRIRRTAARRRDEDLPRMVTTARGQPCAGETETELDDEPVRLPTSRNIPDSPPLISLRIDTIVSCLFELSRLLSIVPSIFGTLYNIHHVYQPLSNRTVQTSRIDYIVCVLWVILTGLQCLALTTGLLSRWKAYYATFSTLIRLVALQAICWPATHFTLTIFDHTKRPLACWVLIGTTTCISRSVQLWVTSNLYMPVAIGDGKVLRREGKLGPRRWDWAEVGRKCVLPAGFLYFITAWAMILKGELEGR